MKIGLAQTNIVWENKKKNYENAERIIESQAKRGTEFIVFPEMSFTGFSMNTKATKESEKETAAQISLMAKKYEMAIGFGWVKDCGNLCENHYTVVDKKGTEICDYVKIHPFSFSGEDQYFRGGNKTVIFKLDGINFSVFICYDLRFPEVFQSVSQNVDAIIVPANWPGTRSEHWKTLLKARAIENQVYILGVNCVGKAGGIEYFGESCIVNPNGEMVVKCEREENDISCCIVNDVEKYRSAFQMRRDRKLDLYRRLYCGIEQRDTGISLL